MLRLSLRAASAALLLPLAAGQVDPAPGMAVTEVLDLAGDRTYATLSDGGYVSYDGLAFERYDAAGVLVQTYGKTGAFLFPSFVEVEPGEAFAYVGESTNGDVFVIDLVAGTVSPLANLPFNFDLAFDATPGLAYVSASLAGFGAGNDVVRLDLASGVVTPLVHVEGPSGPIAVDAAGDLYYVTIYDGQDWPPPLEQEDLILWTDAQLDAGVVLTEADAMYLTPDLDGSSSMVFDAHSGDLFLTNTNAQGWAHEVLRVATDGQVLDTVAQAFTWIAGLELEAGAADAILAPFQPQGSRLRVQHTDFGGSARERVRLEPQRAAATFDGPPTGQSGSATVTVDGALPGGSVVFMLARAGELLPSESALDLGWNVPAFYAFEQQDVQRRTQPLPVDANGTASLVYTQQASWEGALAFQAILLDGNGLPLGTSTHVVNQ